MTKYNIFFGKDFSNTGQIDSFDNFVFYDNTGGKTVKYIKDLVTCFNDAICSCMLKLYKKEKGWTGSYYSKYDIENENDKKIEEIAANSEIYIIQTKKECTCKFLLENKNLFSSNKENLIEKIKESQEKIKESQKNNELQEKIIKELQEKINELLKKDELDDAKQEDFYDIIIDINSIININKGWNIFMTKEGEEKYLKYKGFDFQTLILDVLSSEYDKGSFKRKSDIQKWLIGQGLIDNSLPTYLVSAKYFYYDSTGNLIKNY